MIKRTLKWTKWLTMLLVLLLIIAVLALAGALFTNTGLRAVLWGAQQALPQLRVEQAQGALFPRFTLQGVHYSDTGLNLTLSAQTLSLAVNPNCLLEPSVCINELALSGVKFDLPSLPASEEEAASEADSEPLGEISTPIPIYLGKLALQDIDLNILGHNIAWQQLTTRASWRGNRLRIGHTEWQKVQLALAKSEPSVSSPASSAVTSKKAEPIVLPEVLIPLKIELERFDLREFRLEQETPIIVKHLGLQASAEEHQVSIASLELSMPELNAQLNGGMTLSGDYPLQLELNSQIQWADFKGQTLSLAAQGNLADLTLQASLDTLAQAQINAHFNVLDPNLPFDLQLSKVKAQWPMQGESDYRVELSELSANGSLAGYQVSLQGLLQGKALPDTKVTVQGQGNLDEIALQSLKVESLGGSVVGNAVANWQAPLNWAARLKLNNIQPGQQWPSAQGKISGEIDTSGSLTAQGGWQVEVSRLAVDGELRDYPIKVLGELSVSDVQGRGDLALVTKGLSVAHGPNSLQAKGQLTKQWRMSVELNVPDLSKSLPDAQGKVIGDVILRGDVKQPQVKLLLDADSLQWQDLVSIDHMTLQGNLTPLPKPQGELTLQVRDIQYQQQRIESVQLQAQGSQQKHTVTLDVASDLASTSLALSGRLGLEPSLRWQGELERMWLSSPQGQWLLKQATALSFDQQTERVKVAAHCWTQDAASLCLEEEATLGARGEARLAIKHFDFKQLANFLPKGTQLSGGLDGQVWAKWAPKAAPQLKANLDLTQGAVTQRLKKKVTLGWDKAQFSAEIVKNQLQASWLVAVTDNGDLSGNISIADVRDEQKTMLGSLRLTPFNLDFLQPLIGEYSEAKSNITADVQFHGPMLHPQLNGEIAVDNIHVKGEISPVDVHSGHVSLKFNGYQALLNADIQTAEGLLEVDGDADWQQLDAWHVNTRVHASSMLVDSPPMIKVRVVPDLTLSMQPHLARVKGNIALPWGRVVVEELPPSAISISKDQVLLSADLQPLSENESLPFMLETDVNLQIGDDFQLNAFGLQGNLVGRLNVAQKDKGPFVLGEVNIRDGQYRSFGQDLQIKEGKILMNGPVDQPYLAITAIRNPSNTQDNVIAGVRVTGPSDDPSLLIFSEPAMPQANALSYLLRGQNIDGESGGNAMTTTLIGLSLAQSGKLVGQIGQAFGVQDLHLDTAGSGDDSQVTVSGYILPGLQVKYGVGIFNSLGEVTVRYRLMQDLYLEAVSGIDSAVDLLYQFEFN